jgi:cytochrome c biogenesis protein CcmG/thiol:disulfide interchange protein DsbE
MAWSVKRIAQIASVLVVLGLLGVETHRLVIYERHTAIPIDGSLSKPIAAPILSLPRLDKPGNLSLASLRGKTVVVNFWASWCGPCKEEAPLLERAWAENRAKGVVVLGVDANDFAGDARSFMRRYGLTYPVIHDAHGSSLGHWGVGGLPTTYVVDARGVIVSRVLGGLGSGDNEAAFRRDLERALGGTA